MSRFATGLVVGKFAPLHRGHAWLLDEAAAACERLLVLSWAKPEPPGCEAALRERWLAAQAPAATRLVLDDARLADWCARHAHPPVRLPPDDAPDDIQRAFAAWVLRAMLGERVDAVFTSEAYGDGFAAALSRAQGGAPVRHVELDRARRRFPVSGRQVRADPAAWRAQLPEVAWADMAPRIALLGGESSGKTTLAAALAARLGEPWVPEFGREHWHARGGVLDEADLLLIAATQVERERAAARHARRWLVCDTTPLTTAVYAEALVGRVDPALAALARRSYARTFVCGIDIPWDQDGTRRPPAFRAAQHARTLALLDEAGVDYRVLEGTLEQRVAETLEALGA